MRYGIERAVVTAASERHKDAAERQPRYRPRRQRWCFVIVAVDLRGYVANPVSLPDWELWACALAVERQHGADAPWHIAERIGALALQGDSEGAAAWKAIANRFSAISYNPSSD